MIGILVATSAANYIFHEAFEDFHTTQITIDGDEALEKRERF